MAKQCPFCQSFRTEPLRGNTLCNDCGRIGKTMTFREYVDQTEAEIARLTAERDRARDEAKAERLVQGALRQKAEAERDALVERVDWAREGADRAHEERDAIAAAVIEAAADHMAKGCCGMIISGQIRALTPADAKATLDRMLRQAKAEGMNEAAEIVAGLPSWTTEKVPFGEGEATLTEPTGPLLCADAILARAATLK